MQNLASTWVALSLGRQLVIVGATISVFFAVFFLSRGIGERDMSLLFGGLEGAAAAEVIASLDQQGIAYDVRGTSIFVETQQRDSLRLALAGEGLPATAGQGYELLDGLSGFATTSQMFDAAYWRAKEGELARTIVANPRYRSARVHISTTGSQPFQRDRKTTAAVTVQPNLGVVSPGQVKALQYLVASAVSGLNPTDVAIIDDEGGLLSGIDGAATQTGGDDRAEILRARAERVLAARVGPGNAVVEITLETVTETETISERTVDPESRVAISTDVQESAESSDDSRASDVTVASNVPDGDAGGAGGSASNENSETRSLTNYEVSQTQRDVLRGPGTVKRLTVAVLVNDLTSVGADGTRTQAPRTPEELADLEQLVSSAIGFDADRGDQITLRAMSFEPLPELGTEASADVPVGQPLDVMQLVQIAVLAAVALVLGLFVVRPILMGNSAVAALPAPPPGAMGSFDDTFNEADSMQMMTSTPGMMSIEGPGMGMGDMGDFLDSGDDPVGRLRQMIADRETETLQILENWMEDTVETEKA